MQCSSPNSKSWIEGELVNILRTCSMPAPSFFSHSLISFSLVLLLVLLLADATSILCSPCSTSPSLVPFIPAHSSYHSHSVSQPPPFTLSLKCSSSFPSSPTTSHSPMRLFVATVSSTCFSLSTLPSIPTSPSLHGLWADSDNRQTVTSALDESHSLNCNLRKKCTSSLCSMSFSDD